MKELTILQKMLAAPLVGLLLYTGYMFYTFNEHNTNHSRMQKLQQDYLPVLEAISDNTILFDNLSENLKDAVLANEEEWVEQTQLEQERIENNLDILAQHPALVASEHVKQLKESFDAYYRNAVELSLAMIHQDKTPEQQMVMIERMEQYHTAVTDRFNQAKSDHEKTFVTLISDTTHSLNQLLIVGALMGLCSIFILIGVSVLAARSTRHSLQKVIHPLKDLAEGNASFDKRLVRHTDDEMGELVTWFNQLTDKLEQDYRAIEQLSITDKLTQLYNRTKMEELFDQELNQINRYEVPFSIVLIDLDHFKSVNDTYGHLTGDKVLQELAAVLKNNIRKTDYLGRIGGEEFLIIATHTNLEQCLILAENLRKKIESFDFFEVGQKTGSLGVATYHDGDDEKSMMQRADDCLYYAKEHGRNQVVSESVLEQSQEQQNSETEQKATE